MSFNGLLNQTITLYNSSSVDDYGRETFGSATSVKGRVEIVNKSLLLPNGDVKQIDAIAFVKPSVTIDNDDKVTYNSVNYKVVGKSIQVGRNGSTHHYQIELSRWI
jgi:hypothetical protein